MKIFALLTVAVLIYGCSQPSSPARQGRFDAVVIANVGPIRGIAKDVLVESASGTIVKRFRTDSLGNGSTVLAPGDYRWTIADSGYEHRAIAIVSDLVTRDTLIMCPMCK